MYCRFTDPKLLCRLPHGCLMFNDITCDLHCPLLNILFHKNPCIHSFYNVCRGIKSHAFLSKSSCTMIAFLILPGNYSFYMISSILILLLIGGAIIPFFSIASNPLIKFFSFLFSSELLLK